MPTADRRARLLPGDRAVYVQSTQRVNRVPGLHEPEAEAAESAYLVILRLVGALMTFAFPATTNRVMLCGGSQSPRPGPLAPISGSRVIVFAAVSCQTWAVPLGWKPAMLIVTGVFADRYLLISMTVSAPSADRSPAKAAIVSGSAVVAATLVSPNVDLPPS